MIPFYASERHYLDHLAPIWHALGDDRGPFHVGVRLGAHARRRGIPATALRNGRPPSGAGLVVVASYRDLRQFHGRPVVLVEHGAGQSYGDGHPSYSGGRERASVVLFVVPNEAVAARNRAMYPDTPNAVVGSPRLDRWYSADSGDCWASEKERRTPNATGRSANPAAVPSEHATRVAEREGATRPIVAVSFHWDYQHGPPEGRWAFLHYAGALGDLRDGPWHLIGHGHPRAWRGLRRVYDQLGIEAAEDFEDVLDRADIYVADNSSTLFEFAATGRPVVVLNAPWYRRDVEHGLRFWSGADVGLQVDEPAELVATVERALADPPEARDARNRVVMQTYPYLDGRASKRAADAIRRAAEEVRCRIPKRQSRAAG